MAAVFIHHRDLRQTDNIGLLAACEAHESVYPVFIYTQEQIRKNDYFNQRSVEFMSQALADLKISIFEAKEEYSVALKHILKSVTVVAVYENRDFSPFARQRAKITKKVAADLGLSYFLCEDHTLLPMGAFLKKDGSAYVKFTPFLRNAILNKVPDPQLQNLSKKLKLIHGASAVPPARFLKGEAKSHRKNALKILTSVNQKFRDYVSQRDYPARSTTRLSAHLHFGTISIREAYHAIQNADLRKQLYWREFYMYITEYVNCDYSKQVATRPPRQIQWVVDRAAFKKWCRGETGFPIVDAAMKELNQTGYMHNRCRMIVATFLIFYLGIHWKEGERYFAQNLTDYSYSNNFGGWVWVAALETYSNDIYRTMSIEQQSKRFDPQAEYIRKWIPSLAEAPLKDIHRGGWSGYTAPMLDDPTAARRAGIERLLKKK